MNIRQRRRVYKEMLKLLIRDTSVYDGVSDNYRVGFCTLLSKLCIDTPVRLFPELYKYKPVIIDGSYWFGAGVNGYLIRKKILHQCIRETSVFYRLVKLIRHD